MVEPSSTVPALAALALTTNAPSDAVLDLAKRTPTATTLMTSLDPIVPGVASRFTSRRFPAVAELARVVVSSGVTSSMSV